MSSEKNSIIESLDSAAKTKENIKTLMGLKMVEALEKFKAEQEIGPLTDIGEATERFTMKQAKGFAGSQDFFLGKKRVGVADKQSNGKYLAKAAGQKKMVNDIEAAKKWVKEVTANAE